MDHGGPGIFRNWVLSFSSWLTFRFRQRPKVLGVQCFGRATEPRLGHDRSNSLVTMERPAPFRSVVG